LAGHFAPKQYLDPCPTFEVVIDACNEALGSKLTVDQIANRFINLIPAIPPRLFGKSRWDFEKHFYNLLDADQQEVWNSHLMNLIKCEFVDFILDGQSGANVLVYGRLPIKHWPQLYWEGCKMPIEHCSAILGR
jgi:hypothetical protein